MRTNILTLTLFCIFCSMTIYAQDTLYQKIQDPEFAFEPAIVNDDYSLSFLPKEKALNTVNSNGLKSTSEFVLNNPHSSFVVKGNSFKMIIKNGIIMGNLSNPRDHNKLYKMEVNEKRKLRSCVYSTMKAAYGRGIASTNSSFDIPITLIKIRENIYLSTVENLEPGEYTWISGMNYYTFRIE